MNIISLLKSERDKLTRHLQGLNAALSAFSDEYRDGASRPRRKRKLSAKALTNIRAAQKARRLRESAAKRTPKRTPQRHFSAAGLAKIRAAQRARWARAKLKKK